MDTIFDKHQQYYPFPYQLFQWNLFECLNTHRVLIVYCKTTTSVSRNFSVKGTIIALKILLSTILNVTNINIAIEVI